MVEVSAQPPPEGEGVTEAHMGQRGSPELRGQGEAGLRRPASGHKADALMKMI